jgi:hypothetical protein
MAESLYGKIRLLSSALLLLNTAYLYLFCPDWWIYGLVTGFAGLINLLNCPESRCWRLGISVVIVLGTLETLFLTWSIRYVDKASLLKEQFGEIHEGRHILVLAAATYLTISNKLSTAHHSGLVDVLRTMLVLTLALAMGPAIAYSLLHYVPALSDVMTHSIN